MKFSETCRRMLKRPRIPGLALAAAVLLSLGGCNTIHRLSRENTCNKPQPYMGASSIPPLRIPPGLDAPDTSHALVVPKLDEPAPPPRGPTDPCLSAPPSFNVPHPNVRPGE
ncbi:MAG TPA: hypothetical protein VND24_11740 [Steroidobacteraceae bacterium]|nr:hypothetical protein [Steroidobacteraceae bacterium]